jgi:Uma2 family endonuclease
VKMSRPGTRHGSVLLRIATVLMNQGEWEGHGQVVGADSGIVLAPNPPITVFGADVGFLKSDQLPARYSPQDWLLTMPALIVEVRSKRDQGSHSLSRKIARYLKHGVEEVWEVDPVAQAVIVHRAGADPVRLGVEDELTAEGLIPSLRFPIRRLFAEPDAAR